ncbi:hypothetical protein BDN70DRAFT_938495 [Pholiota conissans]|uniref:Uncharacterized protein n=1 Tax=Pholiota conissans TaxID=109636 RepID=A0A9P5YMS2_9AGAR|nr:hypothetical protein BDN70DRAFT_938495 [Pholiota conissans]
MIVVACTNLLKSLEVSADSTAYQNEDILPLPPARRTWTRRTFVFFWLATSINIVEWSAASSSLGWCRYDIVAIGLTVGQAIAVNAISTIIICVALLISGHAGARWNIPFAVINRTGWGV